MRVAVVVLALLLGCMPRPRVVTDTLEASFVRRLAHGPQLPGPSGPP